MRPTGEGEEDVGPVFRAEGEKQVKALSKDIKKYKYKAKQTGDEHLHIQVTCPRRMRIEDFRDVILKTQKCWKDLKSS